MSLNQAGNPNRFLKTLPEAVNTRQQQANKHSLRAIDEDVEPDFNFALATQADFQHSAKNFIRAFVLMAVTGIYTPLSLGLDLSKVSQEPIKVAADQAELNDKTGQSVYSGNVIITQGRSRLEAETVSVNTDSDGISGFIAAGDLVHLLQYDNENNTETHAYARMISFNRERNEIVLHRKARLVQDNSSFQGEEIRYNTVKRVVTARSSTENPGENRVEIIFQPKKVER